MHGVSPRDSASARVATSVTRARLRVPMSPHVGRHYWVSPSPSTYIDSRATLKSRCADRSFAVYAET